MQRKSLTTAYLLWFFLGFLGIHKFYLDKPGMGFLYMFTFGLLGAGWFIDLLTLKGQVEAHNRSMEAATAQVRGAAFRPQVSRVIAPPERAGPEKQLLHLAATRRAFSLRDALCQTDLDLETAETTLEKLLDRGLLRQQMGLDGEMRYVER